MIICYVCNKNDATGDKFFGWLPCISCQKKQMQLRRPKSKVEMVGEDIKEQRKAFAQDIRPAHRKGYLDKGFVERYGRETAKRQGFNDKEIDSAKYVYDGDDTYYKRGN